MERLSVLTFSCAIKAYCLLTKPGIIIGNAITTSAGFLLASRGYVNFWLFLTILIGLSLIIASACVFNNYIDREADEKMGRTKNRALVKGLIAPRRAVTFAIFLGLLGTLFLALFSNLLTLSIALCGFFVYVILYSFSKYYSIHATLIGSVAGAVPPVVGYCAVSNHLDAGAWILFAMIALWQMPHFFAIAIFRLEDYAAASIPILPIEKGLYITKIHMLIYILAFIGASCMLMAFNYVGNAFLIVAALLGIAWLCLCIKGFKCDNDKLWARKMFFFSLIVIMGISIIIPFSLTGT